MEEIKKRHHACAVVLAGIKLRGSMIGYLEVDIDLLYLQLRKILELVMFASVVAHKIAHTDLGADFDKEYCAGHLVSWIENINPKFFPRPVQDAPAGPEEMRKVVALDTALHGAPLTKDELRSTYARACGNFAHAQRRNQYGTSEAKQAHLDFIRDRLEKISRLLNHHWVDLTEDLSVAIVMQDAHDGNVQASLMRKVA
jgi:hypothetical protein